ncbi:hypothetical protein [Kitasatospora sp. NPDC127116]|uniref:hypothetical protein n=1 Tax=Kitasatospora sp. NPDC127116 TaxID=3345367 RepID=UPI003634DEC9
MKLRKQYAPGSAPGGLTWSTSGDVVEVPDELAVELLAIPGAGFEHVPHLPVTVSTEVTEAPGADAQEAVVEAPKRKYTRRAPTDPAAVSE